MGSVLLVSVAVADMQLEGIEIKGDALPIQERKESSIAKKVVSATELEHYGDLNMLDILRRLPGVNIPETKKGKSQPGKGYTKILVEGEEVPAGSRRRPSPLEQLSADMVEKIEIMTNGSAEHTAEAMGGIVNIILKSPSSTSQTSLKAGSGLSKDLWSENLFVQQEGKKGKISYLVNLTFNETRLEEPSMTHTDDGIDVRDEYLEEVSTNRTASLNTKITYTPGVLNKYTFDGTFSLGKSKAGSDEIRFMNDSEIPDRLIHSTDQDRYKMFWAKLKGEHHLSNSELFEWRIKAHQNSQVTDSLTTISEIDKTQNEESLFRLFGLEGSYSKFYENHFFKTGYELKRLDQNENLYSNTERTQDFFLKETRNSVYFQDEISDGTSIVWTPGIRYENVFRDFSQSKRFSYLAPSLHMLYKLTEQDHFRSSIAKTVKLPRLNELSFTVDRTLDQNDLSHPDISGNPDLKEESAWSAELRYEHYDSERGIASIGGFYRRISDKIEKLTFLEGGRYIERPYNSGAAGLWGIETELKKSLSSYIQGMGINANATFQNSSLEADGMHRRIKETPNYFYTIGVDHSLKSFRVTYGASYRYTGPYHDNMDEKGVIGSGEGYGALDVYGAKRFPDNSKISLNIKNLFAEDIKINRARYIADAVEEVQSNSIQRPLQMMITYEKKW